jgi:hypothetical protein
MVPCQREGFPPSLTIAMLLASGQVSTLPTSPNGAGGVSHADSSETLREGQGCKHANGGRLAQGEVLCLGILLWKGG